MKSLLAGFAGGVLAIVVLVAIAVRLMPKMMERMMADGNCPEAMRECMERCGCGQSQAGPEDGA